MHPFRTQKNNSDWHIDLFDFDFYRAADLQDRANAVFAMAAPPVDDSPSEAWCCNYCEFSHLCELRGTKPKPKDLPMLAETIEGLTVSSAIHDLVMARDLAKQAKAMETEAKQALLAEAKAKGVKRFQEGGYTCAISERQATRFDTAGFRRAHPDLAEQYTTTSTSTYFDLKEE